MIKFTHVIKCNKIVQSPSINMVPFVHHKKIISKFLFLYAVGVAMDYAKLIRYEGH